MTAIVTLDEWFFQNKYKDSPQQPEVAPPKETTSSSDHRKISELLAIISELQSEIRTLKSEKANLSINASSLLKACKDRDKTIQTIKEERGAAVSFQSKIVDGISQEIPGILEKMDGENTEQKIDCLANKIREIIMINRKGSLSCVLNDRSTGDKLRVGFNVKKGGEHITISASGNGVNKRRIRGNENATEHPIGYLNIVNGDVILHFYGECKFGGLNTIKLTSCVNLGNANDGD